MLVCCELLGYQENNQLRPICISRKLNQVLFRIDLCETYITEYRK
jgi:hypothetical protein